MEWVRYEEIIRQQHQTFFLIIVSPQSFDGGGSGSFGMEVGVALDQRLRQ
jgi:hypothetical protein